MQTKLTRSESDKMIAGVCGGLAAYLRVEPALVRLAFLMLLLASGIGLPLYLILFFVMPEGEPKVPPELAPDWYAEAEVKVTMEDIERVEEAGDLLPSADQRPQGPIILAVVLILTGLYLLAQNAGFLGWLNITWLGPLLIIGIGFYVLFRRR